MAAKHLRESRIIDPAFPAFYMLLSFEARFGLHGLPPMDSAEYLPKKYCPFPHPGIPGKSRPNIAHRQGIHSPHIVGTGPYCGFHARRHTHCKLPLAFSFLLFSSIFCIRTAAAAYRLNNFSSIVAFYSQERGRAATGLFSSVVKHGILAVLCRKEGFLHDE